MYGICAAADIYLFFWNEQEQSPSWNSVSGLGVVETHFLTRMPAAISQFKEMCIAFHKGFSVKEAIAISNVVGVGMIVMSQLLFVHSAYCFRTVCIQVQGAYHCLYDG